MNNQNYFLQKNFIKFEYELDFNKLFEILSVNNFKSNLMSHWMLDHVLESCFKIKNVEKEEFFYDTYNKLNSSLNPENLPSDLDIFFSIIKGARGPAHKDIESVNIFGVYGRTLYFIDNEEIIVEKGDRLFIGKGVKHRSLGLTPRIILSFGVHD
jgi:hypothetical protein|tara:strand:- start:5229 stop:5693 length:465 start_codon:yes stop_codon:yes gene_type:complete